MSILSCDKARNKEKGFKGLKQRMEFLKPSTRHKMFSLGVEKLLYKPHDYNFSKKYAFLVSWRTVFSSIFDGQT